MQREIAQYIAAKLIGTPGFSKFGGLVQTLTASSRDGQSAPIRIPISFDTYPAPALNPDFPSYTEFTPNSAESGLLYLEHLGLTSKGVSANLLNFESRLRLVGWMNAPDTAGGATLTAVPTAIAHVLRRLLPLAVIGNHGIFTRATTHAGKILINEPELFSRYSYSEATRQYLLDPYGAFGIDLTTTFTISPACLPAE